MPHDRLKAIRRNAAETSGLIRCVTHFSIVLLSILSVVPAIADEAVLYNRDIRPILADTCFHCHGPDAQTREADLRLDLHADAAEHEAIVAGSPSDSLLYQRIMSDDEHEVMPPPESGKTLTAEQKELLRRWIEQGAVYQNHWAFEPIAMPAIPDPEANANPIDSFVADALQREGLVAASRAKSEVLVRRVAFALTGLPPTVDEVEAYLKDAAPGAYERMVDRYLASPRFGEEMARHWLDAARYADTHGLHLDNERRMWPYRDWVVEAFNKNVPFDEFTVWQVAGDLLPDATTEQLVATGFNRCNVTTSEGGAIAEEFTYRYAVERTSAVAEVWLGLTAGCAACHDHKYDPLTTKEFYSLYAFFNNAADPAMDGNIDTTAPFLKLPSAAQKAAGEAAAKVERESLAWLQTVASHTNYFEPVAAAESDAETADDELVHEVLFDDAFPIGSTSKSSTRNAVLWETDPAFGTASGRRVIKQASAENYTDTIEFKLRPLVAPQDGVLEVSLRVDPVNVPTTVTLSVPGKGTASWTRTDAGFVRKGEQEVVFQPGQWARLSVPITALKLKPGERIASVALAQDGGIAYWDHAVLVGKVASASDPLRSFAQWRKTLGTTPPPELPSELHAVIKGGSDAESNPEDLERLRQYYLAVVSRPITPELAAAREVWQTARAARIVAEDSPPGTLIYREADQPRESFVMLRGQYDSPGEPVQPAVPAFLPPIASQKDGRLSRLELAQWLVAEQNPLTARVTVNRLWQQFFGLGLVRTVNDFGLQGEPASHPELLDWLAANFRQSGWNVKAFVRMLLTSEAFQRQSRVTAEMLQLDPENRLYARGPRLRLDAEQARDNALFASGLIDLTMGGRGVNPYQPSNIWEPVGYSNSNTRFYQQDYGASLYRRSLYVFLKRTAPPPFMSNFDAPNREQVCTSRERSNTPLQALQLMNDVQHFEAARALAERALAEAKEATEERIKFLYRTVLARHPDQQELQLVCNALDTQLKLFQADPESAAKAIRVGESKPRQAAANEVIAAWTLVANLILNLDETINRN
jgi:hypothetical protein